MRRIQYKLETSIKPLYISASKDGLEGVQWEEQDIETVTQLNPSHPEELIVRDAVRQIEEYFAGKRQAFDVPLSLRGTPFQEKVWRELSKIPFGTTVSYRNIAERISHPKAVRAVGNTNGRNPICVIIPCHRVIASDGGIGGYTGGLDIKRRLLALEYRQPA